MKREFNIGDIAHLAKGKRFKGVLKNDNTENYKTFSKKWEDEVKVVGHRRGHEKVGGHIYDLEVEYKGEFYIVDCVGQFDLIPKMMWEESRRLRAELGRLEKK